MSYSHLSPLLAGLPRLLGRVLAPLALCAIVALSTLAQAAIVAPAGTSILYSVTAPPPASLSPSMR